MAYVGFRKPIVAKMTGEKTYDEPFAFGNAVGLQVTPNYAEGSLNADDEQAEYDKEFNYRRGCVEYKYNSNYSA